LERKLKKQFHEFSKILVPVRDPSVLTCVCNNVGDEKSSKLRRRKMSDKSLELTDASLATFLMYAADAGNWSGTPWVSCGNIAPTKEHRGNLSDLVKKGLIVIHDNEGKGRAKDMYVDFTDAGRELAAKHGHAIEL